jgi:RNA:NAD 2'-phosphotransferase (TPT1/KptA family)
VQGHTIEQVHDEELLRPILDPFFYEEVVHGTYLKVVEPIMQKGLCKMARNHIRKRNLLNQSLQIWLLECQERKESSVGCVEAAKLLLKLTL